MFVAGGRQRPRLLPHRRRAGITLAEVLVTLFVLALGLLSLLALFPLGVLQTGQAVRDSRAAACAANGAAAANAWDVRHDSAAVYHGGVDNFLDPDGPGPLPPAAPDGPGWPILVDPIGWFSFPGAAQTLVAGAFPRRGATFADTAALAEQWFTLHDDLTFGPDGLPYLPAGPASLQREGRYSWALLLRRPRAADETTVDVTVCVFVNRPLSLSQSGFVSSGETPLSVTQLSATTVRAAGSPPLRPGGWLLDVTGTPPAGRFYRVAAVTPGGGSTDLELQGSLPPAPYTCTAVVVLENLVEVFPKGLGHGR